MARSMPQRGNSVQVRATKSGWRCWGSSFKSKGLPEQYNQAVFVLWLKREGLSLRALRLNLAVAGRSLSQELPHMYVSGHLAKALMKLRPDLGHNEPEVRQLLRAQFPQVADVSSEQLVTAIEETLSDGKFPTLVVLDEVQQYIGTDADKAFQVQEVTETLSKHFSGKLLFVGTGQSALSGMPNLQRLMGRFPIKVMLGDWDVENGHAPDHSRQKAVGTAGYRKNLAQQSGRNIAPFAWDQTLNMLSTTNP